MLHFGENRDRIRSLEQDMAAMKGRVDVAKAKEKIATGAEAFIPSLFEDDKPVVRE